MPWVSTALQLPTWGYVLGEQGMFQDPGTQIQAWGAQAAGDVFCHVLEGTGRVGLLVAVGGATGTAELEGGERLRDIMRRWGK